MAMTPEERFQKIEKNLLVQAEIVARMDRRVDEEQALHREWLSRNEEQIQSHNAEMAEFRATAARVLDMLERFVAGQSKGHGHTQ